MKRSWLTYVLLITGVLLLAACKNGGKKDTTAGDNSDPVFQSEPKLKQITEEISSHPDNAELYYTRGIMLHRLKEDSLALKDYKKASSLDTGRAEYYSAIGDLLFENKDLTGSVEWLKKALARNPQDKKARLKIAKMFLYIGDFKNGFKEVNEVLMKDVHNPEGYFLKGMMYKDIKDSARAMSSFQTALQEMPDYRDAMIQIGLLCSAKKDPIALKYFDNAFKLDTTDVFPIFAKGTYYQNTNDIPAAKDAYRQCILRNTHYSDAYFNMGYLLMQEDSVQKAWRQYNLAAKNDPRNPAAYYNRGVCSEMMDSIKSAAADYRIAMTLDSTFESPKKALARLKAEVKH